MEELFFVVMFAIFLLVVGIDGCSTHSEKMECIKQRGEWVKDACKFPPKAPA